MRRIAILLVASLGLAGPAWGQTTPGVRVRPLLSGCITTAFVGVTVVPMDSRRILPDQVVLVQGEHILELGPRNVVHVPREAKRIEGRGLFLLPGLADMHVHLMEGDAYFPLFLANGVTTVRNMAGDPMSPSCVIESRMETSSAPPFIRLDRSWMASRRCGKAATS